MNVYVIRGKERWRFGKIYEKVDKRMNESLKISRKKTNREFWLGFLTALLDYNLIERIEFTNLMNRHCL